MNEQTGAGGALTLQINSVQAIERLIGGDTAMELSLRHAVVAEFIKRHLVNLVTKETAVALATHRKEVQEEILRCLEREGTDHRGCITGPYILRKETKEAIRAVACDLMKEEVQKSVGLLEIQIHATIQAAQARLPHIIETRLALDFEKRVDAAVEVRLKQIRDYLPAGSGEPSRHITV